MLIGFYSDGIVLAGYPFYKYASNEGLQIIGDILDGFFPYILRFKHPYGVPLKIVDKTDLKYTTEKKTGF